MLRNIGPKSTGRAGAAELAVLLSGTPELQEFKPLTAAHLYDSLGNQWDGTFTTTAGVNYLFRPQDNNDLWLAGCRAVIVLLSGQWAAAANGSYLTARYPSASLGAFQARAYAASISIMAQGIVTVDTNGYFEVMSVGANASIAVCRLVGFIL